MISSFLRKKKEKKGKLGIIKVMIQSLRIPNDQKHLYIDSLDVLDNQGLDNLYKELTKFVENYELKELEEIHKENFSTVAGMKKKEAVEKQKEINAFSFLLHNI